ncbi:hypothetical protein O4J56_25820 [Nocardiopsis sp. RSe5-2]|uniref:Phage holin family protein n=1 Tax=Nocardiopsis endophytica TaxID=3018445 RepID=A0ABT4UAU3_9ACTN|nr:hypothetical protein [Nocardiopsis endophytica]MDA2814091.1 hypothetical protein [Nocardiopsis endophytica]
MGAGLYLRLVAGYWVQTVVERCAARARQGGRRIGEAVAVARPGWEVIAEAAGEVRWAAEVSGAVAAARVDRMRPRPWGDRGLAVAAALTALVGLAVAALLGVALAHWAASDAGDVLFAASGAVAVGLLLLALLYLVFAEKPERRPPD